MGEERATFPRAILLDVWLTRKGAVPLYILFPKKKSWLKGLV